MSLTISEHRHCRGCAKGGVTKVNTQAASMKVKGIKELDIELLHKQFELLTKADEAFKTHHEALYDQDEDMGEEQYFEELSEHQSAISDLKRKLQAQENCYEAHELTTSMEEALEAMERSSGNPYCSSRKDELERVERLVQDFRTARSKKGASEDYELRALRDQTIDRLQVLQQEVETSKRTAKALEAPEVAAIKGTPTSTMGLKLKLPIFDGSLLKWRDFWDLFSTLINKHTSMDDAEKRVHLVQSMGEAEAKHNATQAVALSLSLEHV